MPFTFLKAMKAHAAADPQVGARSACHLLCAQREAWKVPPLCRISVDENQFVGNVCVWGGRPLRWREGRSLGWAASPPSPHGRRSARGLDNREEVMAEQRPLWLAVCHGFELGGGLVPIPHFPCCCSRLPYSTRLGGEETAPSWPQLTAPCCCSTHRPLLVS